MHRYATSKRARSALALLSLVAFCTSACKKSRIADQKSEEPTSAASLVIDEEKDYVAVVRREQLELRADLQAELEDVDRQLAALEVRVRKGETPVLEPKPKNAKRAAELLARRQQLVSDMTLIDRSEEKGWEDLKASIERNLSRGRSGI